ncbi:hypothetical protein MA16_Dca029053 [Dendrobium catenatum]|uniref:Uncharacterized protein n=1 Tax=Dendrobium catenatum TaxID=906689 RepID=A0A2I0VH75_9ASPA|nr:hypothetical protein MA16_Dca029053 [Dendrobium catenatum]
MSNNSPLSGDLVLINGSRQSEKDPVNVVIDSVVDLQVEVEEGRPENIYSSLKIIHESMIALGISHSWRK